MFPHYKAIIIQREVGDYQLPMQCMGGSMKMIAIFGYLLLITLWITNKECWLQALVGILSDIQGKWCMCSVNSLVILNTQNLYLNNNEASNLFTFCIDRPDSTHWNCELEYKDHQFKCINHDWWLTKSIPNTVIIWKQQMCKWATFYSQRLSWRILYSQSVDLQRLMVIFIWYSTTYCNKVIFVISFTKNFR